MHDFLWCYVWLCLDAGDEVENLRTRREDQEEEEKDRRRTDKEEEKKKGNNSRDGGAEVSSSLPPHSCLLYAFSYVCYV